MDTDDRGRLLAQLPRQDAEQLLAGLAPAGRDRTIALMSYPKGSVGQWMSAHYLSVNSRVTAGQALEQIRAEPQRNTPPGHAVVVTDADGGLVRMIGLRDLVTADPATTVAADPATTVAALTRRVHVVRRDTDVEEAARECGRSLLLTVPVVDQEGHVLGVFTGEDALRVLEEEETEDRARSGGSEPLRQPSLATPVRRLVRTRDVVKVLFREVRVGIALGLLLGALGFAVASLVYGTAIGTVIGLTLLGICTLAASVGGVMPLIVKTLEADPAVFSNPFISTFSDAAGLVMHFLIFKAVLGL